MAIHVRLRVIAFQSVFLRVKDHVQLYYTLCSCMLEHFCEEILNKCTVLTNEN